MNHNRLLEHYNGEGVLEYYCWDCKCIIVK